MIGDVLTSTILFEALREKYPSAELHYLINSSTVPVVEKNPYIDKLVILYPKTQKSLSATFQFFKKIQKEKYDTVIDLYSKNFSATASYFSMAKKRIGKKKWYLSWAYTETIILTSYSPEINVPMAYLNRLDFLKPLLGEVEPRFTPKIFVAENEKKSLDEKLQMLRITEKPIMVNCLGSSKNKTYPLEYMATLLNWLVTDFPDKKIIFNFAPNQKNEAERLISLCNENTQKAILKYSPSGLREFIVTTTFCEAVIGNEGGAINMAKALEIKTWAIFSPWIRPESWIWKNDPQHKAVHLKHYLPGLFKGHEKHVKKDGMELYQLLKPWLIYESLKGFLREK